MTIAAIASLFAFTWMTSTPNVRAGEAPSEIASETSVGHTIGEFSLRDFRGKLHSLSDYGDSKVVVVVFLGTECPLAKLYAPRLADLSEKFQDQSVQFLGIDANRQDTLAEIESYVRRHKVPFPVLKDGGNTVADQMGATRTPEVLVLDQSGRVRYQGRIDDQYGIGYQRNAPNQRHLEIAIEELLAGTEVSQPVTAAIGCFIGKVRTTPAQGNVTFTKDVAAVLNRRCVECHRDGEIAPFPLTSFDDAVSWSDTIREVINEGRMPPWHANPEYGHFSNDARMTDAEKLLVNRWIENGCPEGNPADLPAPREFGTGWRIPKPDLIVPMRKVPYTVPAEGEVAYQFFFADPGFTEDKYVVAAEARPQNTAVVHHITVSAGSKGVKGPGNLLAVYAPGMPPVHFRSGEAYVIPAGSQLIFQLHYTPNGTEQTDLSDVGFVFADEKDVTHIAQVETAGNRNIEIPPYADNYELTAELAFDHDVQLYSLTPHMHLRGKSFRYEAIYPDESREVLLDVPRYDFNWQTRYYLTETKQLPKGTRMKCTAHYDNSERNLGNPDPSATVRFGDQTWEEMMFGVYTTITQK